MSSIFTNQASRHGLSVLLLLPRFLYLSFFFLSLFDFVVLLSLASLFITAIALALSGQSEKAAIFCKSCYAALHGHRSRYNFMFFVHLKYLEHLDTLWLIYPSQRQNLLFTLEIITHNFHNFQKIENFGKKFQNLEFFFQNFQNHKEAANDIKGAAASLLVNSKISIFNWELP